MRTALVRLGSLVIGAALVAGACRDDGDTRAVGGDGDRLEVVASFYPIAEAATRVGGDRVAVTNLTPVGVEPHDIELTPDQVDQIEDADVVLYLGQGFQPAVAEIAERRSAATTDVLDGVDLERGGVDALEEEHGDEGATRGEEEEEEHEGSGLDPHFWLDPRRMIDAVDAVARALGAASPDDTGAFEANAREYADELRALDADLAEGLAVCDRREIVTAHAAFSYLASRYGLTQLPVAGVTPEAEPDADRLATLADAIEATGVTTVFFEELVSPDVAETLAREAGVGTAVLSPIEGLSEEELDAGKDYAAVMRDNLAALRQALGCR